MRHSCLVVLVAALTVAGHAARADTPPSFWDIARDPPEADRWALHVRVTRLLEGPRARTGERELRLEAARVLLEEADAARSPDVRLRFDLGIVYGGLELHRRAVEVLEPALEAAPEHPAATQALEVLAVSYAKLGRAREELDAWRRYIPRLADDPARAGEMMNMGEAEMRLGRLDDALTTFRDVLAICAALPNSSGTSLTYVLTLWDLAVALDRSGDPRGALDAAARAMGYSLGSGPTRKAMTGWDAIQDTVTVFFVPEWEREWYLALGTAAAARGAVAPGASVSLLAEAAQHREAYVRGAEDAGGGDPWLAVARRRRDDALAGWKAAARGARGSVAGDRATP